MRQGKVTTLKGGNSKRVVGNPTSIDPKCITCFKTNVLLLVWRAL